MIEKKETVASRMKAGVFLNTEDTEGAEKSRRGGVPGMESRNHDP